MLSLLTRILGSKPPETKSPVEPITEENVPYGPLKIGFSSNNYILPNGHVLNPDAWEVFNQKAIIGLQEYTLTWSSQEPALPSSYCFLRSDKTSLAVVPGPIGKGGHGVVYSAQNIQGEWVIVKTSKQNITKFN